MGYGHPNFQIKSDFFGQPVLPFKGFTFLFIVPDLVCAKNDSTDWSYFTGRISRKAFIRLSFQKGNKCVCQTDAKTLIKRKSIPFMICC